ncbi:MAG: PorT family protein [Bacteroidetes bacterium HGW-Bacteroidetes-11]|jgi:hypothetical protein|nr:MAG: PorT family protein [Bacteroidetes bacterium HGW-Bacteroidetes-11]
MKKFLLVILVAFLGTAAMAQIPYFSIGPKAGATFSKITSDQDQIKEEMKNSLHFGAFVRLGNKIYVQPEVLFMNRKGEFSSDNIAGSSKSIHLKTLDIPVLLGGKIFGSEVFNVRVMAGPVASLALNKDVSTENWGTVVTEDDIRTANWGLQFGAGIDVLMLTLDLRYEYGISNFSKEEGLTLKNNMFLVSLGWKIL